MLTRPFVVLSVGLLLLCCGEGVACAGTSRPPIPPGPVPVVSGDNNGGTINTTVTSPGSPPTTLRPGGAPTIANAGSGVTCTWTVEGDQATDPGLVQVYGGTWYDVTCSDGTRVPLGVFVPVGSTNVPTAVVQAGALARTARNLLRLPEPAASHSPDGQALVGLATWFWIAPAQWRPLTQRTAAGPVWAEVTATPVSTTWNPGDGSQVIACAGSGTPYDRSLPESAQSTSCSYAYRTSSANKPQTGPSENDRAFTVTVTTTWQVTWKGSGGTGGTLPVLTRLSTFALPVAQRETVATGGSG